MNTEMKNTIVSTDAIAQYDGCAKQLLGQKIIIAHILTKTVEEFNGRNPKDVVRFIEGQPYISKVPIESGLTNKACSVNGEKIVGFNTENSDVNEGVIRFDIVVYVNMKNGLTQIILNVEAQKDEPDEYNILNRAIFYVSRLISSQKERDFSGIHYNDIKQVYSIWVCMNMKENTLNHIHLTDDRILGDYEWGGNIDAFNIIMIGLSKKLPEHDKKYELHRLLGALLSKELTIGKKLDIIKTEYGIPVENKFIEELNIMCNLGEGLVEEVTKEVTESVTKSVTKSVTSEINTNVILKMNMRGYSIEQIADIVSLSKEEIEEIIKKNI